MNKIVLPIELTAMHWILAFAGAFIYVLLKIQEMNGEAGYKFGDYLKKHWASTIATIIMIPVSLLILSENFPDILPINNITATLVGYQTNSMFKTLMSAGANKFIKKEPTNEANPS